MRQIVLDTETTGINPLEGHRLIEIGCVELIDRKLTGNHYHQYINPQRVVDQEAIEVHGITNEFLEDKPLFTHVAAEFMEYIKGAELVIHNAAFDVGFLDHELKLDGNKYGLIEDHCTILDTLQVARDKHPGQRNSLDALCKRYGIDNSHRELHGALLDSEILADVYLLMTGGQTGLALGGSNDSAGSEVDEVFKAVSSDILLSVVRASDNELQEHSEYIDFLNKKTDGQSLWQK